MMKYFVYLGCAFLMLGQLSAQTKPTAYLGQLHSHNDYSRNHPFELAYGLGFGSIEVDLFLEDGQLFVAHERAEISADRTFEKLYLQPLLNAFKHSETGYLYPEKGRLQLLIDAKTDGGPVLDQLQRILEPYRELFDAGNNDKAVRLVISGKKPAPGNFKQYDRIFSFDGDIDASYTADELERIGLFSASFASLSSWNGLGRMTDIDMGRVKAIVDSVHALGKPIRFWASPDTKTSWSEWLRLGIDYINTDKLHEAASFVGSYPSISYIEHAPYVPYRPQSTHTAGQRPKNIILLISDGAGLSQMWASAQANRGELNVLNMPYTGYLMTGSTDNYHTDSAAGGSALATGVKTKNRYIGVDSLGQPIPNIPEILVPKGIAVGIISNDALTGATPSAFYAHVNERDSAALIAKDLLESPIHLMIGGADALFFENDQAYLKSLEKKGKKVVYSVESIAEHQHKQLVVLAEDQVDQKWNKLKMDQQSTQTQYRMIEHAFGPAVRFLENVNNQNGFFLMVEGAKIDGGGHSNSLPFTVQEYLSFDRLVGQALAYADQDGETLVIVTSDHETGGLTVLDVDQQTARVVSEFATTDHTGIPVPLMAYGPGATHFRGFMDNSEIAGLIDALFGKER